MTPSSQLVQDWEESEEDWQDRCQDDYDDRIAQGMSVLQAAIMSQWPGNTRPSYPPGYDDYFKMSDLILEVLELFEHCTITATSRILPTEFRLHFATLVCLLSITTSQLSPVVPSTCHKPPKSPLSPTQFHRRGLI